MSDPGPRKPGQVEQQSGTGAPRSADDGLQEKGALAGDAPDVTAEELTGMTTSSHPADADDLEINRSGSGGTGGASADGESMEELLSGEPDGSTGAAQ